MKKMKKIVIAFCLFLCANLKSHLKKASLSANQNGIDLSNFPTTPATVGSVYTPIHDPFNVMDRLAEREPQIITNREAYDIVHKDLRSYYDNKRFIVHDRYYNKTEAYFNNEFKAAFDSAVKNDTKLVRVDDFDKKSVDLHKIAYNVSLTFPLIHKDMVKTDMHYDPILPNDEKGAVVTSSDPYVAIHGGLVK